MGVLGLDDEDFWSDPFRHREDVIARLEGARSDATQPAPITPDSELDDAWMQSVMAFAAEHPEAGAAPPDAGDAGIFLDGPTVVRNDLRDDVPLAGATRYAGSVAAAQRFHDRAVLVVVRAASNEVFAGRLFEWKEPAPEAASPPGDLDASDLDEPTVIDFFVARVRERIPGFTMRASLVRAVVLCGDERSNAVTVSVEDPPESNPAVSAFIAQHRSPGFPRAVSPPKRAGEALPSYLRATDSPEQPSYGIALKVPDTARPGASCVVRGSFALPVIEREVVRPFDASHDRFARLAGAPWVDVGDRDASAVVGISLVVVREDVTEPAVLRLDVPVYGELAPLARGHFSVDLASLPGMFTSLGTYSLWAVSGDVLVGPRALTITQ